MARRIRKSLWSKTLRSIGTLARATVRSGTRAVAKAVRKPPGKPPGKALRKALRKAPRKALRKALRKVPRKSPRTALRKAPPKAIRKVAKRVAKRITGRVAKPILKPAKTRRAGLVTAAGWTTGVAVAAGTARRYQLYRPHGAGHSARLPLLVMLHGCRQNAERFERSTRLQALAAQQRFCLLYPDQDRLANAHGCWNWYEIRSGRALGEAAAIIAAIDQVCELDIADPACVAVAGLSAGASLAALLGTHYPLRFKAVAMHSGIGPGAAQSSTGVLGAMRGRRKPSLPPPVAGDPALPPLLVIQGSVDAIVRASNGRAMAQVWADQAGAQATPTRTVQRGKRHPMAVTDFELGTRRVATLCEVQGLGHAWSGGAVGQPFSDPKGPDASRMIWAFAARQFRKPR